LPFAAPKPASPLPFSTTRPSPPPPPAAVPAPVGETVQTTIAAVSDKWPAPIRQEIEQFKLGGESLSIPIHRLEAGMKIGRVVFTWAELCGWLSAPLPATANGESQVELPLHVIAPLFLAKHRPAAARKMVSVGENVPDLFAGLGRPPAPAPTSPIAPSAAPTPPASAAAPNVLGEIFGQPSVPDWTPKEIVRQMLALPGVAGALLASNDGLLVAGQMPAPLKTETMAAFLPQVCARVESCTEEMNMGALRALRLSAGQAPCAIFKAGALYLAVLGRPGQTLPEAVLERIAGELAQQKP
jgi:predicted regulator of Ras-like GTPase activity (Roadblock/LC7/MglB family)